FQQLVLRTQATAGRGEAERRLGRLVGLGILLLLAAGAVALLGASARLDAGLPPAPLALADLLNSSFGRVLALRLAAAALLPLLVGLGAGRSRSGDPMGDGSRGRDLRAGEGHGEDPHTGPINWPTAAALVLGAGLAFLDGLSAHATSVQPLWLG